MSLSKEERNITRDMFRPVKVDIHERESVSGETAGYWKDAFRRLKKNKAAIVCAFIILFFIIMALFGPLMNRWGMNDMDLNRHNLNPRVSFLAHIHWLPFDG